MRKDEALKQTRAGIGQCKACGEVWEEKVISLALPRSEHGLALVRNVPAEVCSGCGETRFSLKTAGRLSSLFLSDSPPEDVAAVPIYNLERAV